MSKDINYNDLSQSLFHEINQLRTSPQSYIEKISFRAKYFKEKILTLPNEDPIQTSEGPDSLDESIQFLKKQKFLNPLVYSYDLSKACQDHVNDIGPKGLMSHEGSDGKNVTDRIEKYCEWETSCGENLDFGFKKAENIIVNLIIDDGVEGKFNRKNLFNSEFKYVGIACGAHKEYGICSVFAFCGDIRAIGDEPLHVNNFIRDYINNTMGKKKMNDFQEDDPDAPDNTVSVKILKVNKKIKGKDVKVTKKIYCLDNGAQHIVEIDDS